MRLLAITVTAVLAVISCLTTVARADDVADVEAAEMAFNAAQNAGDIDGMFKYSLPDRTVYGPSGGRLTEGWTEESKKRRQAVVVSFEFLKGGYSKPNDSADQTFFNVRAERI